MTGTTAFGPVFLGGVADIVGDYDVFLLDLWGVVHDGERPYAGAVETLQRLKAVGRAVVLLSNAPRLGSAAAAGMAAMGIDAGLYTAILTSGDVVNRALRERDDPDIASLGATCYFLGPDRDWNVLNGTGVSRVDAPDDATFVLCTGPLELDETEADYQGVLEACLVHGLPMVCANPDRAVIRGGRRAMCAGALADVYRTMGGTVIERGKPDPHIFRRAVEISGREEPVRAVMIGDGLHTDMPGAAAAGIDSVFIAGGLNAAGLGVVHGQRPEPDRVRALLAEHDVRPVAVLPALTW